MKLKLIGSIVLITFFSAFAFAQDINKPKLDSLLNILAEKNKSMGSLAVSKNGNLIYSKAFGYSLYSENEKVASNEKTKYRIGSISKMFTATMIFQLVEEGKLKLTTTIDKFYPEVPNAKKITIANLLNHSSGIHNFTDDKEYQEWMTKPVTKEEMLNRISKLPIDYQPGEKSSYSNTNFVLLGFIVEKICKKPYADCLKQRITSKIGLSDTYMGSKTDIHKNEAYSYQYMVDWLQSPETDMSIPGGAGAVVSTPSDLCRFIEALFSLKLVSAGSLEQMKTITNGYGMGMFKFPFYNKSAYGHNGGIDAFISNLSYFPEENLTVAFCSNGKSFPMNDILIGVLSICFNKDYAIPTFEARQMNLTSADLDKYLGVYASKQIPIKITITKNDNKLIGQGSGQSPFTMEATAKDIFAFDAAGIIMEFNPETSEMTLKQGGGKFLFVREAEK